MGAGTQKLVLRWIAAQRQTSGGDHESDQSARLNGHDPYAYLKDILMRLPAQRASEIDQLLPHKWQPVKSRKA